MIWSIVLSTMTSLGTVGTKGCSEGQNLLPVLMLLAWELQQSQLILGEIRAQPLPRRCHDTVQRL